MHIHVRKNVSWGSCASADFYENFKSVLKVLRTQAKNVFCENVSDERYFEDIFEFSS